MGNCKALYRGLLEPEGKSAMSSEGKQKVQSAMKENLSKTTSTILHSGAEKATSLAHTLEYTDPKFIIFIC